jgi:Protein of unknown function (DUF3592)
MSKVAKLGSKSTQPAQAGRLYASIFMMVFIGAFGAIATIFGLLPIADAASTLWRAQSLVEVPATVNQVQLHLGSRSTQRHLKSLSVRYSYKWKGVTYESTRVSVQHWEGWHDSATWHKEWFDRLERARQSGATVPAWVSTSDPPQAVLDKELRWARLFLAVPLLFLFGGVSLFFGYHFIRIVFRMDKR